jgi:hypothetical protein
VPTKSALERCLSLTKSTGWFLEVQLRLEHLYAAGQLNYHRDFCLTSMHVPPILSNVVQFSWSLEYNCNIKMVIGLKLGCNLPSSSQQLKFPHAVNVGAGMWESSCRGQMRGNFTWKWNDSTLCLLFLERIYFLQLDCNCMRCWLFEQSSIKPRPSAKAKASHMYVGECTYNGQFFHGFQHM